MVKMTPRDMSATTDTCPAPILKSYVESFSNGALEVFEDCRIRCQFMQSDGGLADFKFLSGLAGGVLILLKSSDLR